MGVLQLVEGTTDNRDVVGSIPATRTNARVAKRQGRRFIRVVSLVRIQLLAPQGVESPFRLTTNF